ncbi:hypothetical protein GCM10018781_67520 [Kitasatospora indigofera]|uniref:Uncharacterized protein n=1 Tax=Kitasatospora indigofera TaxID=67307 RepID=A0A919GED9_9ACTN|nr:hypothetical protein [Kitasatospora indigofera]GHH82501.1 hypothetical protein GCM10018781_67520 [Kitasatospora indigofera]
MFNRKRSGRRTDSATWEVALTLLTGLMALGPGSRTHHIVLGTAFAIALTGLLCDVVGRLLLRRAAAAGRLKGRHSLTDHHPAPEPPSRPPA